MYESTVTDTGECHLICETTDVSLRDSSYYTNRFKFFNNCFGPLCRFRTPNDMKTKERWILCLFIAAAVIAIIILWSGGFSSEKTRLTIDLEALTDREKCPACFGVNLCPQILMGSIALSDWTKYSVSRLMNKKNVYYATWKRRSGNEERIILKKLAHDHELEKLDESICQRHGKNKNCDSSNTIRTLLEQYDHPSPERPGQMILHGEKIGEATDVLLCPSHKKMEFLLAAAAKFNKGQHEDTIRANALTSLLVNPEPLLLQAFPQSKGFPFPTYYGSCGRIVAEEYAGPRLTMFIKESFKTRVIIAKQLLEIANLFYDNDSEFILYMTDVSPDNFAVDENTLKVKIIDLENIMVVDKDELFKSNGPETNHLLVSESIACPGSGNINNECFSFSTDDLCTRPRTDHNFYAICAGLLAPESLAYEFPQGFLHSIPYADSKLAKLPDLLQECKTPSSAHMFITRSQAAQQMIAMLDDYLNTV